MLHLPSCRGVGAAMVFALTASVAWGQGTDTTQVLRGRYLAKAGDCAACHTAPGGKPYAGGFPVPTPFGTIYSTNITPDPDTGLGKWSDEDFYRAMHFGIRRDGQNLYPAFPYPWFTRLSRQDVAAIKAYLDTQQPVHQENRPTDLPWPLSWRAAVKGWNLLFFEPGDWQPDPQKSELWNRGAYLVEGAGHCSACHTAKNVFGATKGDHPLQGGDAGDSWYAPALTSRPQDGLGQWTTEEIVEYLQTGSNAKSAAAGPMTDVIMDSTQHLDRDDLTAIAVYLKDLPGDPYKNGGAGKKTSDGKPADDASLARGQALYIDNCMGCHMVEGDGQNATFPPLKGSSAIMASKADSLVHMVLAGGAMPDPAAKPTGLAMPGFAGKLDDREVADVVNYIRNEWGNQAPGVGESDVKRVREDVRKEGKADAGRIRSAY